MSKYENVTMFMCTTCGARTWESDKELPFGWWEEAGRLSTHFHVCNKCQNTMAAMFHSKELTDHILMKFRLGQLGYIDGYQIQYTGTEHEVCPTCLSIGRTTVLAEILERIKTLLMPWKVNEEESRGERYCGKCGKVFGPTVGKEDEVLNGCVYCKGGRN